MWECLLVFTYRSRPPDGSVALASQQRLRCQGQRFSYSQRSLLKCFRCSGLHLYFISSTWWWWCVLKFVCFPCPIWRWTNKTRVRLTDNCLDGLILSMISCWSTCYSSTHRPDSGSAALNVTPTLWLLVYREIIVSIFTSCLCSYQSINWVNANMKKQEWSAAARQEARSCFDAVSLWHRGAAVAAGVESFAKHS